MVRQPPVFICLKEVTVAKKSTLYLSNTVSLLIGTLAPLQACGTVNRVTILTDRFGSPKVGNPLLQFAV